MAGDSRKLGSSCWPRAELGRDRGADVAEAHLPQVFLPQFGDSNPERDLEESFTLSWSPMVRTPAGRIRAAPISSARLGGKRTDGKFRKAAIAQSGIGGSGHLQAQPALGVSPVGNGGRRGNSQRCGRCTYRQTCEESEFYEFRLATIVAFQLRKCFVQGNEVNVGSPAG